MEYDTTNVRQWTYGKSSDLTQEEVYALREEQRAAEELGVDWRDRGPVDAPYWRGQAYRHGHYGGSKGYRNRGGKWREYYAELNRQGRLMPSEQGAKRVAEGTATDLIQFIRDTNEKAKGIGKGKSDGGSAGKSDKGAAR